MKKILKSLIISLIILFLLLTPKINAKEEIKNKHREGIHNIEFENLNSKNLNNLFIDLSGSIISIEVRTPLFTKNYYFNTNMTKDIENLLLEKVSNDLKKLGKHELVTTYRIEGIKIIKMDIRCTEYELEIIKSRTKVKEQ